MKTRNSTEEWKPFKSLEGMVRLILLVDWDPIGIFGAFSAMDEYDSYAQQIAELLEAGIGETALIEHLTQIETEIIGLKSPRLQWWRRQYNRDVARKLLTTYHSILWQKERRRQSQAECDAEEQSQ